MKSSFLEEESTRWTARSRTASQSSGRNLSHTASESAADWKAAETAVARQASAGEVRPMTFARHSSGTS